MAPDTQTGATLALASLVGLPALAVAGLAGAGATVAVAVHRGAATPALVSEPLAAVFVLLASLGLAIAGRPGRSPLLGTGRVLRGVRRAARLAGARGTPPAATE